MSYRVELRPSAARQLRKLPSEVQERLVKAMYLLGETPRPPNARKLAGSDYWRVRIGDYRIIYTIDDGVLRVAVVRVAHRREAYR